MYPILQLINECDELIVDICYGIMRCGKIFLQTAWAHRHKAVLELTLLATARLLSSHYGESHCATMLLHSPGHHKQQIWPLLSAPLALKTPSASPCSEMLPQASAAHCPLPFSLKPLVAWHNDGHLCPFLCTTPHILHNDSGYAGDRMNCSQCEMYAILHTSSEIPHQSFKMVRSLHSHHILYTVLTCRSYTSTL